MYNISIMQFPIIKTTQSGQPRAKQPLTVDNIQYLLDSQDIDLRLNVMTNMLEFRGNGITPDRISQRKVLMEIEDTLTVLDFGLARLPELLDFMAADCDSYHPMEDWMMKKKWDGKDRLTELTDTVPTDSRVFGEYLRKWLIQTVEAVRGWRCGKERSIPHVLVFVGGQGAGKGRWLRMLAPGFVMSDAELHLNSFSAKDQQLQALRYPIVELGEIDSTFKKSDVSALKSFLSRPLDSLRAPYAKAAIDRPRMTVFAGSVNNAEFLNDPTGARRFWPVHLTGELNWDHGIDMQQVFAQANHYWEVEQEDWNLEDDIEELRREDITQFVQQAAVVDMVEAHLSEFREDYANWAVMNKTEICRVVGGGMHPGDLANVTEYLNQRIGPPRKLQGKFRCWPFPIGATNVVGSNSCITERQARLYAMAMAPIK